MMRMIGWGTSRLESLTNTMIWSLVELNMWFYKRFIESDLDYDPAVLRTVYAECISTHYESVNDSSESRSEVCIMCRAWLLSDEWVDVWSRSEWMCGPGVTLLSTCVPVSMSNYPIIRLSVMHEDVAVYDLIWRCCSVWLDRDFAAYRATRGHIHNKWKLCAWMKLDLCVKDGSWVSFLKCSHMTCVLFVIGTLLGESWERWFS